VRICKPFERTNKGPLQGWISRTSVSGAPTAFRSHECVGLRTYQNAARQTCGTRPPVTSMVAIAKFCPIYFGVKLWQGFGMPEGSGAQSLSRGGITRKRWRSDGYRPKRRIRRWRIAPQACRSDGAGPTRRGIDETMRVRVHEGEPASKTLKCSADTGKGLFARTCTVPWRPPSLPGHFDVAVR
jgi:hypothetical protein